MGAEGTMNYLVEKLRETERVMGADNWTNYALEKLRETEKETAAQDWINHAPEKMKEWLVALEDLGGSLIRKLDEVFPPETRKEQLLHWIEVATPCVIMVVVLLIFLKYWRCCCGCGGRAVKMMTAPGRGFRMPRAPFEANPGAYFRGLRGK